jgi:hypothetical protein
MADGKEKYADVPQPGSPFDHPKTVKDPEASTKSSIYSRREWTEEENAMMTLTGVSPFLTLVFSCGCLPSDFRSDPESSMILCPWLCLLSVTEYYGDPGRLTGA